MKSTRTLGIDLYRQLRGNPGNLLISPYSIWLAVAMLLPGARGRTRDQLAAVLGIEDTTAVATLGRELAKRREPTAQQRQMIAGGYQSNQGFGFHLDVANKLWVQAGYRINPAYGQALAEAFGVDPAPVDFAGARGAACDAINRWVNDQTRGRIPTIVSPPLISPVMRALLANAIYFKAGWAGEFFPDATRPAPFKLLDGTTARVPMMRQTRTYAHAEDRELTAVELPYIQPDVAMTIVVPHPGAFADVDRALTLERVDALVATLAHREVDLQLPKFKFESSLRLSGPLAAVGLTDVLSPAADLSGISDEPGFGVGEVLHKTFIAVDEQCTEAAAVTAIGLAGCAPMARPKPIKVHIDRPFYLVIRDVPTGTALFLGRVVDPR